jgi:hypothetical protein
LRCKCIKNFEYFVRLGFASVGDFDDEKNEIKMSPSSRVVMTVDGFMRFVAQANTPKEKLLEQSV